MLSYISDIPGSVEETCIAFFTAGEIQSNRTAIVMVTTFKHVSIYSTDFDHIATSTAALDEVRAKMVVLAIGSFQESPVMTSKFPGQGGDNIFVSSNRGPMDNGLRVAIKTSTETIRGMDAYYGHLLVAPLQAANVDPKDYLPLAQYRKCAICLAC